MFSSDLSAISRTTAISALKEGVDLLVIGGGATGAGIALDAATRGLSVGIIEAQDWSAGTSSRSSRLIHGGLRYLYNLDFGLVAESLRERGVLLTTTAPHLVTPQPFLWPLRMPVIERAYSAVGVGMYDALAVIGARGRTVPTQRHYGRKGARRLVPDLRPDALVGAIRFYDSRVDDARLVVSIVRTAVSYGAHAASRVEAVGVTNDGDRRLVSAADLETGESFEIPAKDVVVATGVFTEDTQRLLGTPVGLKVLASKGIHIVVPRERIKGSTGVFLRTETSVLFVIPWPDCWVIGTTDTPWNEEDRIEPAVTATDVDYLLKQANSVLSSGLTREDIIGVYAGLRPLLQPAALEKGGSAKVSREHTVMKLDDGVWAIAGGKLTTYRVMAEDAVDMVLGDEHKDRPSVTATTPLVGASGLEASKRVAGKFGAHVGWDEKRMTYLISRYGSAVTELVELAEEDPSLADLLGDTPHVRAEVAHAVVHEGALHLEDVLERRTRLAITRKDRGLPAAEEIADIMGGILGWTAEEHEAELASVRATAKAVAAALMEATDAAAARVRSVAPGIVEPIEGTMTR